MKTLKKLFIFLGKKSVKHRKITVPVLAVIVLWCLFMPTHILTGGANMGKLRYSEELNTITVDGHLYPRLLFFAAWSQASDHKPTFNSKADKMVNEWLQDHPELGFKVANVSSSDGDRETSFFRSVDRKNRRLQITREYTLEKKSEG